ncbi:hypothetical protein K501DRAFT_286083 [Backusella circina FSU 941]|nr:hypothetical protein K501DRAFT_286083 [Backusella circina FSU 941]
MVFQLFTTQQPQTQPLPKPLFGEPIHNTTPAISTTTITTTTTNNNDLFQNTKKTTPVILKEANPSDKRTLLKKSSEFRKKAFVNWREGGRISKKLQAIVAKVPNLFKQNPNMVTSIDPAIHQPGIIDRILGRVVRAVLDV